MHEKGKILYTNNSIKKRKIARSLNILTFIIGIIAIVGAIYYWFTLKSTIIPFTIILLICYAFIIAYISFKKELRITTTGIQIPIGLPTRFISFNNISEIMYKKSTKDKPFIVINLKSGGAEDLPLDIIYEPENFFKILTDNGINIIKDEGTSTDIKLGQWQSEKSQDMYLSIFLLGLLCFFIGLYIYSPDPRGYFIIPLVLVVFIAMLFIYNIEKKRIKFRLYYKHGTSESERDKIRIELINIIQRTLPKVRNDFKDIGEEKRRFDSGLTRVWSISNPALQICLNGGIKSLIVFIIYITPLNKDNENLVEQIKKELDIELKKLI